MIRHSYVGKLVSDLGITQLFGEIKNISPVEGGLLNHVFRIDFVDADSIFLKHASNTIKSNTLGDTLSNLSPERLIVENRALNLVNSIIVPGVETPNVIKYDDSTNTILMSQVCRGGKLLENELKRGVFNLEVARKAITFLVNVQKNTKNIEPLRETRELDYSHWIRMLNLRTVDVGDCQSDHVIRNNLKILNNLSKKSEQNGFMNLDFCPKNIIIGNTSIGVIDFELSSSYGDPAFDIGFFLGHYLIWGIVVGKLMEFLSIVDMSILTYRNQDPKLWETIYARVPAFIGATILYRAFGQSKLNIKKHNERLRNISSSLLSNVRSKDRDILRLLRDAVG